MRFIPFFISFFFLFSMCSFAAEGDKTRFVYLSDLNLLPTPDSNIRTKSIPEKAKGLLVHESQAVLQDLISYINLKINPDFVFFGGNNVADYTLISKNNNSDDPLQLFLDMASQLKPLFFIVIGDNEYKQYNSSDLVRAIKSCSVDSSETWWSYKVLDKNLIFVGLNSSILRSNDTEAIKQHKWLAKLLATNKNKVVVLFMHDSLVDINGKVSTNKNSLKLYRLIKQSLNVKLVVSGNCSASRLKLAGHTLFVLSTSPISYPGTFRSFEISDHYVTVSSVKIPLKGIIKKSEKYLIESDWAKTLPGFSPKAIKTYVEGSRVDNSYTHTF